MKKYASFAEMNMIPIIIPKAQLLSFVTRIYWNLLFLLKHFFSLDFACHVIFSLTF